MKNPHWVKAIKSCADSRRAKHFVELLSGTNAKARLEKYRAEQAGVIVTLFSGSEALGNLLVTNPDWLDLLDVELIRHPRRAQGLWAEIQGLFKPLLEAREFAAALGVLRTFKQREMLRIGARDLARLGNVSEITREMSDLADVCLESVWQLCRERFTARFGLPFHQDAAGRWHSTPFCVVGLGKLGGQELNFSSDVDVMFVYGDEGEVFKTPPVGRKPPPAVMSNHQFFCRLGEAFIEEVSRVTDQGFLFRIDLRLRPEGDAGPLCRSLESCENYYAQWGQTWERMMLIKARGVAGDGSLAAEFLETIQSFRFPRFIGESVLSEIAGTKNRIETEIVGEEELDRNVKLGRGGIREIEFIVQTLQLLHAGRQPFLQIPQTLPCLDKLAQYQLISEEEAVRLASAYCFLRDVEHRLQMDKNLQTHTIPVEQGACERLAKLMGFASDKEFESARRVHTKNVRRVYDGLIGKDVTAPAVAFPMQFEGAEAEWKALLARHRFRDLDKAFAVLEEFVEGPGYVNVSPRTVDLARLLLRKLFALCPPDLEQAAEDQTHVLSDPDRVVTRLDSFISAYGARSTLFELWNTNPGVFELLLLLFDRSEFLAEVAIRTPDLVDDLVTSGRLRRKKSVEEILQDLRYGLGDKDQFAWLRRYHETEFMRIGLRDILGLADCEQNFEELSALAEACLQYALETVMRRNKLKKPPFVIVGMGKLGGREINYGSDLDIIFVTDSKEKELLKLQKMASETMELMSRRTELGIVFVTDARLRPDGEKGLLVNTLAAYEKYYRKRAQLWEIQSLTRARPVAGDMKLGARFQQMAASLTHFSGAGLPACFAPDWKKQIHQMRLRIEKERTPRGKDDLAIKTGKGGLMDAEFVAQALCLEHGWQEANTLRALEKGWDEGVLSDGDELLENYRHLRRVEGILRRWSYEGETVLPDDPEPYYRVSVRCGFATPEAFRSALAQWRGGVRAVYLKVFAS